MKSQRSQLLARMSNFWPRSLFGRLSFTWILALLLGHLLNTAVYYLHEIDDEHVMADYYLQKDVVNLVQLLESLAPTQRAAWLARFQRDHYQFSLTPIRAANTPKLGTPYYLQNLTQAITAELERNLGRPYPIQSTGPAKRAFELNVDLSRHKYTEDKFDVSLQLQLRDGTPLSVQARKYKPPLRALPGIILLVQTLILALFTWLAVRQATRPLQKLAISADRLGSALDCEILPETGPSEVASAAAAFNRMQRRIQDHLAERMQILAAISHDLQTPITRMRLRADLLESEQDRNKIQADLDHMQALVAEGIAYARSAHSSTEARCRIDLDALLESLVFDYSDADQPITLQGHFGLALMSRPKALRRVLSNLIDNALKYSDQVSIQVSHSTTQVHIEVLDHGPGIPEGELQAVLQPFYRVEASRNRSTGGTGLGLAIAWQLSLALEGNLVLSNRAEGGLAARLSLPLVM